MKTNAIIRIVVWSVVILVLVGLLLFFIGGVPFFHHDSVSSTAKDSTETYVEAPLSEGTLYFSPDQVRDLQIEWVSGSILVQPGDVEEIVICETGVTEEKYVMVCKQAGSKLDIQFCKDSTFDFNFGITINNVLEKDLLITVPRDWTCNALEVDAASATLEVNGLTIRNVEFDGASGTCDFVDCKVGSLDLDTASGDIYFSGSLEELDCDAASASFTGVLNNIPSRIDMDSMSGDLDITLPENAGFTVSMSAMSSDFSSDFETVSRNGSYVCGDGRCRINVDAMSGDVTIRKQAGLVSEALTPAETESAVTHHFHTEECTTNPDSCPDSTSETHHNEHE